MGHSGPTGASELKRWAVASDKYISAVNQDIVLKSPGNGSAESGLGFQGKVGLVDFLAASEACSLQPVEWVVA